MVIAVDTGNRCIKTAHADPFSAGLIRHFDAQPIVSSDTLYFEGNYYTFSETQGYHRKNKTADDTYFILTLAAIAREIIMKDALQKAGGEKALQFSSVLREAVRAKGLNTEGRQKEFERIVEQSPAAYSEDVFLSVGLPPRDMKAQKEAFRNYFLRDGKPVCFTYNSIKFEILITDVCVSPQGFAAIFPNDLFKQVIRSPQAYIIDIGGYTTDVAFVVNRRIDQSFFESMPFGVIHMGNEIIATIDQDYQQPITGVLIEAVLQGESIGKPEVEDAVRKLADAYARRIIAALRDRGVELELSLPVLVGGGVQLLRSSLEKAIRRDEIFVIPDIRANAIGYEVVANRLLKERRHAP